MSESVEQQIAKVVDDAVGRRDPTLPRWASARITRMLRELDSNERQEVVERICDRSGLPAGIAADLRTAAERAAAPAPPPPAAPVTATSTTSPARRPRSSSARPRPSGPRVQARTFKGRNLADVPDGTRVEYQGKGGMIEQAWLVLDDGRKFQFLNPASVYVNGGVEVNGWDAWKVTDGRSLAECHESGSWPPVE
jgi:hypothetical protein